MNRRRFLALSTGLPFVSPAFLSGKECLPQKTTFINEEKFQQIVALGMKEQWATKPIGWRIARIGLALEKTPYQGFTLEIDDHVESPSVNFSGLDCWTFFEAALGLARMLEVPRTAYAASDLLREIEWTRYRGGICTGNYLERLHYMDDWFFDNEARGNVTNVTRSLGHAIRLLGRKTTENSSMWKSYRYLRENPDLRPGMREVERKVDELPVWYIPKAKVALVEPMIQSGDIIGIVTKSQGGVCSHVGLALQMVGPQTRFLHASKTYKQVYLDKTIAGYLNGFEKHAGIMVARPLPRVNQIADTTVYQARLGQLIAAAKI